MTKQPYVGAMVHYKYRATDSVKAAIITALKGDMWVSLRVLEPGGLDSSPSHVEYGLERGWKWIPDDAGTPPSSWNGL